MPPFVGGFPVDATEIETFMRYVQAWAQIASAHFRFAALCFNMVNTKKFSRRSWLQTVSGAAFASPIWAQTSPAIRTERPSVNAVMSGGLIDQGPNGAAAVIWGRANKPSRMQISRRTSEFALYYDT
jgi:hypothetical protein